MMTSAARRSATALGSLREAACGVLCAVFMCSAVPPSPASAGSQPPRPSTVWSALLEAFTRHDERGKAAVQTAARHVRESPERQLARVLLDEWGPPLQRERLEHPEIVLLPGVAPSTRTVTMEIFDLNVRVGPDGRVLAAEFVKPPQQPPLSREVLAKVRAALFRPSFREGRFVESEAVIQFTVHVK